MFKQKYTEHALVRSQQRSIEPLLMDIIMLYGEEEHIGGGAKRIRVSRKNVDKVKKVIKKVTEKLDKLDQLYLIEGPTGQVITAAHAYKL